MIVLIVIAAILLLLLVLKPAGSTEPDRGWSGFVAAPSSTDRDEGRVAGGLRVF